MTYSHAVVLDGRVHQLFDADPELPKGIRVVSVKAYPGISEGWLVDDVGKCSAPPVAQSTPVVPEAISDRQFFQQLAIDGDISEDEALAAVQTGTLPKKLADAIASLPEDQRFAARMLVCGATTFLRSNAIVPALGEALEKDAAALDALWIAAAAL